MKLQQLLVNVDILKQLGPVDQFVQHITFDSRQVKPGSLFLARKGVQVDGHQFISKAIEKGAQTIVLEKLPKDIVTDVSYIQVQDAATALGMISRNFFHNPSSKLKLVGITGTNGKTTTVTLLHQLFKALGYKVGLLSTIQNLVDDKLVDSQLTTPDIISINQLLQQMVDAGCAYAFMEVSSHAVDQKRIAGLHFSGGIFSNMSHDHLDYHGTFKAYIEAKKGFFDQLPATAFALVNIDDKRGPVMIQNTKAKTYTYSLQKMADFKGKIIENTLAGLHLKFNDIEFFSRLIGRFNGYNLLAVFGTAILLDQNQDEVLIHLSNLRSAPGRFEYIREKGGERTGIVDYAHTPDALQQVLETINALKSKSSRVITVVGCGGDRDKDKRPKMANIACTHSDLIILTSDNPRTEVPETIIQDMASGIPVEKEKDTFKITDRKEAIKLAVQLAKNQDILLIAGKGHENYQEINGQRFPFDDKQMLNDFLNT